MNVKRRNVIIDCDPGVDDSFAIAVALQSKELNVLAIHTVAGNVRVEHTTRNARGIVKLLNSDVEICQGASKPLVGAQVIADAVHGNNGLAGYEFEDHELAQLSNKTALESYVEKLTNTTEPIDIIAVGPLTNVATLLISYPHLKEKIGVISIMGGGVKGGNITAAGEFNFYADPEAAHVVFTSGVKLIMAGLDVTEKAKLYEEDIETLKESNTKIGHLLSTIVKNSLQRAFARDGVASTAPNDACSVLILLYDNLFIGKELKVEIETAGRYTRGMSVADQRSADREKPNCLVLFDVNETMFREVLLERIINN